MFALKITSFFKKLEAKNMANVDMLIKIRDAAEKRMNDIRVSPSERKQARVSYRLAVHTLGKALPKAEISFIDPDSVRFAKGA